MDLFKRAKDYYLIAYAYENGRIGNLVNCGYKFPNNKKVKKSIKEDYGISHPTIINIMKLTESEYKEFIK